MEKRSGALNSMCGFSHSCAESAEILYKEYGYSDMSCLVARACQGWEKSPGHFTVATGEYKSFGCKTTKTHGNEYVRRCMFSRD